MPTRRSAPPPSREGLDCYQAVVELNLVESPLGCKEPEPEIEQTMGSHAPLPSPRPALPQPAAPEQKAPQGEEKVDPIQIKPIQINPIPLVDPPIAPGSFKSRKPPVKRDKAQRSVQGADELPPAASSRQKQQLSKACGPSDKAPYPDTSGRINGSDSGHSKKIPFEPKNEKDVIHTPQVLPSEDGDAENAILGQVSAIAASAEGPRGRGKKSLKKSEPTHDGSGALRPAKKAKVASKDLPLPNHPACHGRPSPGACQPTSRAPSPAARGMNPCRSASRAPEPAALAKVVDAEPPSCTLHASRTPSLVFMLSGIPSDERASVKKQLGLLKGRVVVSGEWEPGVKAVLMRGLRRSDKVVCAMAAGCWLLDEPSYIKDSKVCFLKHIDI